MTENQTIHLLPVNEVIATVIVNLHGADVVKKYAASPQKIAEDFGIEVPDDATMQIVENTPQQVHLSLPYYQEVENAHATALEDGTLEHATGGEFFFIILPAILIGAKIASIVGASTCSLLIVGGTVGASAGLVGASVGTIAAGAAIGGAVGTGIAAGVAAVATGAAAGAGALPVQNK